MRLHETCLPRQARPAVSSLFSVSLHLPSPPPSSPHSTRPETLHSLPSPRPLSSASTPCSRVVFPALSFQARSTPCSNGTTRRPRYPGAQRPLGSRDRNGSARAPPHVARATHPHPFLPAGPARRVARDAAGRPTPGMLRARGGALRGGAKLAAPGVPRAAGRG